MSIESMEFKKFPHEDKENKDFLDESVREENLCKLAERIFIDENSIGFGNTADVFTIPEMTNVCCKKLNNNIEPLNSLDEEGQYLDLVQDLTEDVVVPSPVVTMEVKKKVKKRNLRNEIVEATVRERALLMKEIDGVSIEDILEGRASDPLKFLENFDIDDFFDKLQIFLKRMHEKLGVHHRDLHPGNVMIERGTLKPVVIDFGHAAKKYGDNDDVYKHDVFKSIRGRMTKVTETFPSDMANIEKSKQRLMEEIKTLTKSI